MSVIRPARAAALAGLAALSLIALAPAQAEAHSHVSVGIGVGFPVYGYGYGGYYRPYHHRPYYPGYYRPYYPPAVIYAPPPVVYAPPPVVYAPPPQVVYQQPVQAVPTSDIYRRPNGQYCREYQTNISVQGQWQRSYGTACQDANGTWRSEN